MPNESVTKEPVGRRIDEVRSKVDAALADDDRTGTLRSLFTRLADAKAVGGYAAQDNVDQVARLVRNYIAAVPGILDALRAASADPVQGEDVTTVLNTAEHCFLASTAVPDHLGLPGILDNAYAVYQVLLVSDPQNIDPEIVASHQMVRSILGFQHVSELDQLVASALGFRNLPSGESVPQAPRAALEETSAGTPLVEDPTPPAPYEPKPSDKAGDLDATFGHAGRVTTDLGKPYAAITQPNGKIVVAGTLAGGPPALKGDFSIARYQHDGQPDSTFGNAGHISVDFGSGGGAAHGVALQTDGRLVVAGYANGGFAVARLLSNGGLDPKFGRGGRVVTKFPGRDLVMARAVALQPDGKILVAGHVGLTDRDFALVRYLPDGNLDTTFGSGMTGMTTTDFSGGFDEAFALAIQEDGRIVLAGRTASAGAQLGDFGLARYNSTGLLDETFGNQGKVATDFSQGNRFTDDCAYAVLLLPDGRIVVAGTSGDNFSRDAALARYTATGILDTTFGADGTGRVVTDFGTGYEKAGMGASQFDEISSLALLPDGRYLIAGSTQPAAGPETRDFLLACYGEDGELDSAFATGGVVTTDFGGAHDAVCALVRQPDGRIVAVGHTGDLNRSSFALARYINPDCVAESPVRPALDQEVGRETLDEGDLARSGGLDLSFGDQGVVITPFGAIPAVACALRVQSDGRIVLAGTVGDAVDDIPFDLAIVRYEADGQLDQSFADGGRKRIDVVGTDDTAHALAIQEDGKIVIAGELRNHENDTLDFLLVRLESDGSLDTTFNETGVVVTDFMGTDDAAYAVAVQDDGKIIVAGYTTKPETAPASDREPAAAESLRDEYFALARYLQNGRLDDTFGVDGVAITPFAGDLARARALCIQQDGHILAAGIARRAPENNACDFAIARYGRDGALDGSFGSDGLMLIDIAGTDDGAHAMALQPDGKIVLAGTARDKAADTVHALIVRLDQGGMLDATFNGNGVVLDAFIGAAHAVDICPDGTILAAGYMAVTETDSDGQEVERQKFVLAAYHQDGSPNAAGGPSHLVRIGLGGVSDEVCGMSLQADGRILLAGTTRTFETSDLAIVCYTR